MANTGTTFYNLQMPAKGDYNWDDENNGNISIIDGLLGRYIVSDSEPPGASRTLGMMWCETSAGSFIALKLWDGGSWQIVM